MEGAAPHALLSRLWGLQLVNLGLDRCSLAGGEFLCRKRFLVEFDRLRDIPVVAIVRAEVTRNAYVRRDYPETVQQHALRRSGIAHHLEVEVGEADVKARIERVQANRRLELGLGFCRLLEVISVERPEVIECDGIRWRDSVDVL